MGVCKVWNFHSSEVEDFILPGWHYIKTTEPLNGCVLSQTQFILCANSSAYDTYLSTVSARWFWIWNLLVQRMHSVVSDGSECDTYLSRVSTRQFWRWYLLVQRMHSVVSDGSECDTYLSRVSTRQFWMWYLLVQRTHSVVSDGSECDTYLPKVSARQFWMWYLPVQRTPLCSIALRAFFLCALLPQLYCKLGPGSDNTGLVLHNCVFAHALVWSTCTALPTIHIVLLSQDIQHTFPTVPIVCILCTGCPEHLEQNTLEDSSHLELYTVFISK